MRWEGGIRDEWECANTYIYIYVCIYTVAESREKVQCVLELEVSQRGQSRMYMRVDEKAQKELQCILPNGK